MRKLIILFCSICTLSGFSQSAIDQLPAITIDDFKSTKEKPKAEAQILSDIGNTYFWEHKERIENVFEKTTRIQVLNKAGYEYATVKVPIYEGKYGDEEIISFTASSYNIENGKVIKETVDKSALFVDQVNQRWKQKKYAFPNVKEGTIIEYSYKISSPYSFHLDTWYFQHEIPVVHSKYKIRLCPFYNYNVLSNGFLKYDTDTVYTDTYGFEFRKREFHTKVYEWELNDVPAFKDELFVPSNDQYKMKVEFQLASYLDYYGTNKNELMTTWEKLIDELLDDTERFGTYIDASKKDINQILSQLSLEGKTKKEKIDEILKYVRTNYYWNKYRDKYASQTKKNFLKSKSGNAADINLFLHSLFTAAEIESHPILLSTRSHGEVYYQYPFSNLFNYVAVLVADETGSYFVDATNPLLPMGMLPPECVNNYGLQVKKVKKGDEAQFFSLSPSKVDLSIMNQIFSLNQETGKIEGKAQIKSYGYKALNYRSKIKQNGISSLQEDLAGQSLIEISALEVKNIDDIESPLIIKFNSKTNIESIGDKVLITPFPVNRYTENKLKKKERLFPVDYGNIDEEQLFFTLNIPEGFEAEFVPENQTFSNKALQLEFAYIVQKKGSSIQIMAKIKRGKTKYDPEHYQELKAFYDLIVDKINDNIVLKKGA